VREVKTHRRGSYTLVLHDRSVHHNFHLAGPGVVCRRTSSRRRPDVTITLVDGVYTYVCDPHAVGDEGSRQPLARLPPPPPGKLAASSPEGSKVSRWGPLGSVPRPEHTFDTVSDRTTKWRHFGSQGQASRARDCATFSLARSSDGHARVWQRTSSEVRGSPKPRVRSSVYG